MSDPGGGGPVPGWYPDPTAPGTQRYWDGNAWTEHTAPLPAQPGQSTGAGYAAARPAERVDTWLWQSIVVSFLCCQPLGIVGIVFAAQAQGALNAGNVVEAREKAGTAKTFALIGAAIGLVIVGGGMLFFLIGIGGAVSGF